MKSTMKLIRIYTVQVPDFFQDKSAFWDTAGDSAIWISGHIEA